MLIQETYVDADREIRYGESEPYEPFTDDPGKLFRNLRREYGRCKGYIYSDSANKGALAIGWIFEGTTKYDDSEDTYKREVWVTLFDECEHDHDAELTENHGRKQVKTGLRYHVLKKI